MSARPRNKKYNPVKRRINRAHATLSRYCIAWRDDWEKSHVVTHSGSPVTVSYALGECLTSAALKWDLMVCVLGRRQDGQEYVKTETVTTPCAYFNQDMTSVYYERVSDMVANFNPRHLVATGWIIGVSGTLDDVDPTVVLRERTPA